MRSGERNAHRFFCVGFEKKALDVMLSSVETRAEGLTAMADTRPSTGSG